MQIHHSLFKLRSWIDLDLFYAKVKFGHLCLCMGKMKMIYFSKTIAAYDLKVGRCIELNDPTGTILVILYSEVSHMLPAKYQPNRPVGSGVEVI